MSAQPSKGPDWTGETAVIVASGPSLTPEQVERAALSRHDSMHCQVRDGVSIIAVNSTALCTNFWDVAYSGDLLWFKGHHAKLVKHNKNGRGSIWTSDRSSAERWGLSWVRGVNRPGLGRDGTINMLGNSGAQAIQLAYLFGARRIILLGFDMKVGPKGEKHHHPDHPAPCVQEQLFAEWIHKMRPLAVDLKAAGCEVINCTPGSALPWFPMAKLEDVLR